MKSKARYQKVYVTTWTGESLRSLSDRGKLLWLYLLTCPQTTMVPGVIPTTLGAIAGHLGWSTADVETTLVELTEDGMAAYDPAGLVWLPNGIDHNPPDSTKNVKGWEGKWLEVPACPLKLIAWDHIHQRLVARGESFAETFRQVCARPSLSSQKPRAGCPIGRGIGRGMAWPMASQEQYQEQEQEQKKTYSAPAARALACTHEDSTPPEPTSAHEPPPSAKTAPCALPDDEDDPTGPLTSRGASLPLFRATTPDPQPALSPAPPVATPPAPVVVMAPEPCPAPSAEVSPAPVETAAPVTPAPSPSAAASGKQPTATTPATPPAIRGDVGEVFAHWSRVVWANATIAPKATKDRLARIKARLSEGYTVAELCLALDGVRHDPWLMGTAPGARPGGYRDIETVLRDGAQVERLAGLARANAPKPPSTPRPLAERLNDLAPLTAAQQRFIDESNARPLPPHLAHIRDMSPAEMLRAWNAGQLGCSNGAPSPRREVAHA